MPEPLLEVEDLRITFDTRDGAVEAVNGVSFSAWPGRTTALLGESGSGKSVTAQAVLGILDTPPARITGGSIRLQGRELVGLPEKEYRRLRGERLAIIFQDALSSLNPVLSVGYQIAEMFRVHRGLDRRSARQAAVDSMQRVGIPAAAERSGDYPHQFSGGMRQRVMIAMMIALSPELLIADEPTTALDVTVQAQIMALLSELQREQGTGLVLISHDLRLVANVADDVTVMYAGRVMEQGRAADVLEHTDNPYTRGLLGSIPQAHTDTPAATGSGRLPVIPGRPASALHPPSGCPFQPRCPLVQDRCREELPPLQSVGAAHHSRCWFAGEGGEQS